jgi:hypothetical protein
MIYSADDDDNDDLKGYSDAFLEQCMRMVCGRNDSHELLYMSCLTSLTLSNILK